MAIFFIGMLIAGVITMVVYFFQRDRNDGSSAEGAKKPSAVLGVLRSSGAGEEWESASRIEPEGSLERLEIFQFIADPASKEALYALTAGGLFLTENMGESWKFFVDESGFISGARINGFAIDPVNPARQYLAAFKEGSGRLLRSQDSGKHWEQVYASAVPKKDIGAVSVDPNDSKTVYAGTDDGLLLQSQDMGTSWKALWQFSAPVGAILIPQRDSRVLYVALSGKKRGFLKSTDYGYSWQDLAGAISRFPGGSDIRTIVLDPANPNRVLLGSAFGLLESKDGGVTFSAPSLVIPPRSLPVTAIALDRKNTNTFYVGASNGFYKTVDGGEHWTQRQVPSHNRIGVLYIDPQNPDRILAGMRK